MNLKLFYMGDMNNMPAENIKDAEHFISNREYTIIATNNVNTGVRLSALSNLPGQTVKELYFATDVNSQKIKNIWDNPSCEVMFTDGNGQIMLSGKAEILTDAESKKAKWNDNMLCHFPDGAEDSTFCVVRFKTSSVRAMIM